MKNTLTYKAWRSSCLVETFSLKLVGLIELKRHVLYFQVNLNQKFDWDVAEEGIELDCVGDCIALLESCC